MNKKYDKDFVLKFLEPLKIKLKDSEYVHVKHKMELECEFGHTFFRDFDHFKRFKSCPTCRKQYFKNNEYIGPKPPVKKAIPKIERAIKACENKGYIFLSYQDEEVTLSCKAGHKQNKSLNNVTGKKYSCRICSSEKQSHGYDYIKNFIKEAGETLISSFYKNCDTMLTVKCKNNHDYLIRFNNYSKGHRCPECFYKKETLCREIIENLVGKPFPKKRPDFMRLGEGRGQTLELDGYNEELQVAFEYDGEQHYLACSNWGGQPRLDKQLERDAIKDQKCFENRIKLLRIPYFIQDKEFYIKSWLIENKIIT